MFYQPRFSYSPFASAPSHFHTNHPHLHPSFDDVSSYDSYDAHRSALEAQALARQQQARRDAEQAALERQHAQQLRQQQYEAALEAIRQREVEVARRQQEARRQAAYEAAVRAEVERRREAYAAQLEYQRKLELQRRARLQAVQEQRRGALAAEQRRYVAAAEDEEVFDFGAFVQHILESAFEDTFNSTTAPPVPASSPTPSKPVEAAPSPAPKPADVDETPSHPFDIFAQILDAFIPTATTTSDSTPAPAESTSAPPAASTSTSTPTAPAPSPAAEESAATTLQRRFRNHLFRKQQLSTISSLTSTIDSHTSAFTLPASLTFVSTTSPKLAYSANNKPFHAHEDFLVALLSQIDEVASKGDRVVKTARKQLVRKVEEELKRLDDKKAEEFEKFKSAWEGKDKDKEVGGDAAPEAPTTTPTIDPPEVPLPTAATTTTDSPFTSTPLTSELLANIPSTPFKQSTPSHHSDSSHSTDVSTLGDYELSRTLQEVLNAAQKLGEEVLASEKEEKKVAGGAEKKNVERLKSEEIARRSTERRRLLKRWQRRSMLRDGYVLSA
ncbi:bcl-2 associated athanogene 3-like protein [Pseudohyphozyma bogoriensis]|nr:bcl-2 associated athanogene 3-like protein [Pseudohyphozyma bogoriensis]